MKKSKSVLIGLSILIISMCLSFSVLFQTSVHPQFYVPMEGNGDNHSITGTTTVFSTNVVFDTLYGIVGQGARFNGNATIKYSGSIMSMASAGKTLGFWFRTTQTGDAYILGTGIASGTNNAVSYRSYQVEMHSGIITYKAYNTSSVNYVTLNSTSAYNDGNWHYVRVFKNNTVAAKFKLFIDEVALDSTTVSGTMHAINSPGIFGLGGLGGYVNDKYIGDLDIVMVINGIPTKAQTDSLYNAGVGSQPPF